MSPTALNLRHLRAVAAAVRLGSFGAAARAIGISQPAVTQAIGKLEALLGTQLLERGAGPSRPLDAGILLAARAEAAGAALAAAFKPQRKGGTGGRAGAEADITMAQLTALLALADHGSYAAGAAALGLAQPSVHRAVAELERQSGLDLVERRGRGVALTEAGDRLAAAARIALAELQAALDELAVLSGRDQGMIRIGADAAALALLATVVVRFIAEHAPVVIDVEETAATDGADRLRAARVDALLVLDHAALAGHGIERSQLFQEPFVIAARATHPLCGGAMPGPVRLAQAGWAVAPPGAQERDAWEKLFLDGGLYPPVPNVTCPSAAALLDIAAGSDLLTVAPQGAVAASGGRLAMVGPPLPTLRRLVLATRAGWAPTPAQATFLEELRAAATRSILDF